MENSLTLVKVFLQAPSKEELISLQIKNNIANGYRFIYGDPIKEDDGYVTWYFADLERHIMSNALEEQLTKDRETDDSSK